MGFLYLALLLSAIGPAPSLQDVFGSVGGSVSLSVSLTLPAVRQVTWKIGDTQIVTAFTGGAEPLYTEVYKDRCIFYENTTLQLDKLTPADQGNYSLTVQNLTSGLSKVGYVYLTVYGMLNKPNLIVLPDHPTNGTNITLYCDARSQSVESYTFHRDQQDILCNQSNVRCQYPHMYFEPVTEDDDGDYSCSIQNPISNNRSDIVKLTVIVPVTDVRLQSNSSNLLWVGLDSVSLTCSAIGTNISYSWSIGGSPLPTDQRYQLKENNSVLIISPVSRNDNRSFTCTAKNIVTNVTSAPLNLSLAWPPEGNIKCSVTEQVNQTLEFLCSWPGGHPPANLSMTYNGLSETAENQVSKSVAINQINYGSNMSCKGTQGAQTVYCTRILGYPQAVGFVNNSIVNEVGNTAVMAISLISSTTRSQTANSELQTLPANFTWFKLTPEHKSISTAGPYVVKAQDYESSLTVSPVTTNENGTYECKAKNVLGTTSFLFILDVKNEASPSSGLDAGAIAGIVIGVIAFVAIIGIIVFFIVKSKKKKSKAKNFSGNFPAPQLAADDASDGKDEVKYSTVQFNKKTATIAKPQENEVEYSTVRPAVIN